MMRLLASLLLLSVVASAAEKKTAAPLAVEELAAPAARHALGAALARSPDGEVWLTWIERGENGAATLRWSRFDAAAAQWSAPRTLAAGRGWVANAADFPSVTLGAGGRATACWLVENPPRAPGPQSAAHNHEDAGARAMTSSTTDGGQTWSPPVPLTRESTSVEFVSLATLADGRVLAAWLDGRARRKNPDAPQQLCARIVGASGPDALVDPSVCDCCQTTLTAFPDGTALLAYRGRTEDEVRDIRLAQFDGRAWDEPRPLNHDDWRLAACPVNGPRLVSDGGRVGVAWFTAADREPRVLASFSPDAGARFLMPLRLDTAKPAGRVDALLLRDGALLVTWASADGALTLRRISPEFSPAETLALAPAGALAAQTVPRAVLLRDYAGGRGAAQVLVAFAAANADADAGLRVLRVTIPEGELLEAEKNCDCAPTPEQLQGFPLRGKLVNLDAVAATLRVQHGDLPGIFRGGTRDFKVERALLSAAGVQPGREFLARIERRGGEWWLFDLRLIAER
jgi:hypothetical protein